MVVVVSQVEGGEGETNFPKELVPTKPVPVPDTQPQGTRLKVSSTGDFVLQWRWISQ